MAVLSTAAPAGRRLHSILFSWWTAVLLALVGLAPVRSASLPTPEYQIKAVFLFNFAQFVEWPAGAFDDKQSPLVIGILGKDPFGGYLDDLVREEKIGARRIVVRRFRTVGEISTCHILFVGASLADRLERILPRLKQRQILTVGDADNFTRAGGMVRFATENGKIRLRINLAVANACGLKISSKILRPATIVSAKND